MEHQLTCQRSTNKSIIQENYGSHSTRRRLQHANLWTTTVFGVQTSFGTGIRRSARVQYKTTTTKKSKRRNNRKDSVQMNEYYYWYYVLPSRHTTNTHTHTHTHTCHMTMNQNSLIFVWFVWGQRATATCCVFFSVMLSHSDCRNKFLHPIFQWTKWS